MKDKMVIEKSMIPYEFNILLGGDFFTIRVDYNAYGDFFTIGLYKNGEVILRGEPIVYNVPLFMDVYKLEKYPCVRIVPYDLSREVCAVNYNSFGKNVFLYIDNGGDN